MNCRFFKFFTTALFLLLPITVSANETTNSLNVASQLSLSHHIIGYLSIAITVLAYIAAMSEEVLELSKSKPMVLGSVLVWFAICIHFTGILRQYRRAFLDKRTLFLN